MGYGPDVGRCEGTKSAGRVRGAASGVCGFACERPLDGVRESESDAAVAVCGDAALWAACALWAADALCAAGALRAAGAMGTSGGTSEAMRSWGIRITVVPEAPR